MTMYSVVILTLNEARDLPHCLSSVRNCDDVVLLDSGSTDTTVELAHASGARVFHRVFDDFAGQRNFAQKEIRFKHDWAFHLDADEQMTDALDAECRRAVQTAKVDGFLVAPKMIFRGRWIPRCTDFPAYQARLVRVPEFRFIQVGHGQRESPAMRMGRLQHNYLHDLSTGGEEEWLDKHRRYARAEARRHFTLDERVKWSDLLSRDALRRRRALKLLSYSVPARPLNRFLYQYVLRGGFLDGAPGLHYCRLIAEYERYTVRELRLLRAGANL
jgi:glycosyltransferase involved in cell wall biosynthesis